MSFFGVAESRDERSYRRSATQGVQNSFIPEISNALFSAIGSFGRAGAIAFCQGPVSDGDRPSDYLPAVLTSRLH